MNLSKDEVLELAKESQNFQIAMNDKYGWNALDVLDNPAKYSEFVYQHVFYAWEGWQARAKLQERLQCEAYAYEAIYENKTCALVYEDSELDPDNVEVWGNYELTPLYLHPASEQPQTVKDALDIAKDVLEAHNLTHVYERLIETKKSDAVEPIRALIDQPAEQPVSQELLDYVDRLEKAFSDLLDNLSQAGMHEHGIYLNAKGEYDAILKSKLKG